MPSAIDFKINVDGISQLNERLLARQNRIGDLTPFWEHEALPLLRDHEASLFAAEGAADDLSRWAPLAESTLQEKSTRFPGHGILERTGRLEQSLAGGGDTIEDVSSGELRFGTRVEYAIFHQRGTKRMPQRPVVHLSERIKTALISALRNFIRIER